MRKKLNRMLSILLIVLLVVSCVPVTAFAALPGTDGNAGSSCRMSAQEPVAYIGDTPYLTFEEAIAAAEAGDTVEVGKDFTIGYPVTISKPLTLQLNGHTVLASCYTMFISNADLTVLNGTLRGKNIFLLKAGSLTLKHTAVASEKNGISVYGSSTASAITVDGDSSVVSDCADQADAVCLQAPVKLSVFGTIERRGGTAGYAISALGKSSVNVEPGARILGCGGRGFAMIASGLGTEVQINGGTITGAKGVLTYGANRDDIQVQISGGTFRCTERAFNPELLSDFLAEGMRFEANADGSFTVVSAEKPVPPVKPVAEVNGVCYGSVEEALQMASSGDTVTICEQAPQKVSAETVLNLNKNITLDLNGKTLGSAAYTVLTVRDHAKVTVRNGKLEGRQVVYVDSGSLQLNGVTAEGSARGILASGTDAEITVDANSRVISHGGESHDAICFQAPGVLNLYGSVQRLGADRGYGLSVSKGCTVNIYDGARIQSSCFAISCGDTKSPVNIFGGTVTGEKGVITFGASKDIRVEITGGTFSHDPSRYVKSGYAAEQGADGLWTVAKEKQVIGDGSEANPYLITDRNDLKKFRDAVNEGHAFSGVHFKLDADISLAGEDWQPIAENRRIRSTSGGAVFSGSFDGAGHTVSNLSVSSADANSGLFGYLKCAEIRNLNLQNAEVTTARDHAAAVAGFAEACRLEQVTVSGKVKICASAGNAGGLACGTDSDFVNCSVRAAQGSSVQTAGNDAGGLCDLTGSGVMDGCSVDGLTVEAAMHAGGLTGSLDRGSAVKNSSAENTQVHAGYYAGGISGYADANTVISGCRVKQAVVHATDMLAGGLAGIAETGCTVTDCALSDLDIRAKSNAGGLIGTAESNSTIRDCNVKDANIEAKSSAGGVAGTGGGTIGTIRAEQVTVRAGEAAGGIVGFADSLFDAVLTVEDCTLKDFEVSAVDSDAQDRGKAGAFVGNYMNYGNRNTLTDCTFEGRVLVGGSADGTETNYVGNLTGNPNSSGMSVKNCHITYKYTR